MEDDQAALSQKLIDVVAEISEISDYRSPVKKQYTNLARRLKLLSPMFEEIRDSKDPLPHDCIKALAWLLRALESAKELLRFGGEGSKIYLVGMPWLWIDVSRCLIYLLLSWFNVFVSAIEYFFSLNKSCDLSARFSSFRSLS